MSKKDEFISFAALAFAAYPEEMNNDARLYWEAFVGDKSTSDKPVFTDNGKLILKYLQAHQDIEMWKAREIAEGMMISSRSVSGAMRKLCSDGFVEKIGQDPVIYTLTETGKTIEIDE